MRRTQETGGATRGWSRLSTGTATLCCGSTAPGRSHRCPECGHKRSGGKALYSHQRRAAAIALPERNTVLPLMPEAITRQEGARKNDGERNAAKRLLRRVREDPPKLKFIVIRRQPGQQRAAHRVAGGAGHALYSRGQIGRSRHVIRTRARGVEQRTLPRVGECRRAELGARWKVENETFNTLKKQRYPLEHNDGHGKQHLATVFAPLTRLAFRVDPGQEASGRLFQAARNRFHTRIVRWERLRNLFIDVDIPDCSPCGRR